jgi:hypothetical protein
VVESANASGVDLSVHPVVSANRRSQAARSPDDPWTSPRRRLALWGLPSTCQRALPSPVTAPPGPCAGTHADRRRAIARRIGRTRSFPTAATCPAGGLCVSGRASPPDPPSSWAASYRIPREKDKAAATGATPDASLAPTVSPVAGLVDAGRAAQAATRYSRPASPGRSAGPLRRAQVARPQRAPPARTGFWEPELGSGRRRRRSAVAEAAGPALVDSPNFRPQLIAVAFPSACGKRRTRP